MSNSRAQRWKPTAIHEAGHAVVGAYLRIPVERVTIECDGSAAGHVIYSRKWLDAAPYVDGHDRKCATANLAGRAADELLCDKVESEECYRSDERNVLDASGRMDADEDFMAWRQRCLERARKIVRLPHVREAIVVVSDELLRRGTLSGKHVRTTLRKCFQSRMMAESAGFFISVHEAGHAVVAAHLRFPLFHVTIKRNGNIGGYVRLGRPSVRKFSHSRGTDDFKFRTEESKRRELARQMTNHAIVILAARAAVERYAANPAKLESCYEHDERQLRALSASLMRDKDYGAWRAECLNRAREIVSVPHVRCAILEVAMELARARLAKRGVSGTHVRQVLRRHRDNLRR